MLFGCPGARGAGRPLTSPCQTLDDPQRATQVAREARLQRPVQEVLLPPRRRNFPHGARQVDDPLDTTTYRLRRPRAIERACHTVSVHAGQLRDDVGRGPERSLQSGRARDAGGRALPRALLRRPVLELEPGDQLVFLCAHASVHGLCRLVQVLDLFGMATRTSAAVWDRAAGIACATGLERSFWAAAHVIAELPGVDRDSRAGALDRTRPPQPVCRRIQRVVNLSRAVREV